MDWFVQMCLGLKHVHDRKILHRDIKTQNIFVSAGGLLKLGDFGVSKILQSTFQLAATAVGTPYYLSPEICQNRRYNQKSDIWSLGCVLYELAVGKHAFEAPSMRALIQKIIKGQYPPMPTTRSRDFRDLCDRMLTLSPEKRPSINEILATPVVKARIAKFLSATLHAHEFSHTIIHGQPGAGAPAARAPPAQPRAAAPQPVRVSAASPGGRSPMPAPGLRAPLPVPARGAAGQRPVSAGVRAPAGISAAAAEAAADELRRMRQHAAEAAAAARAKAAQIVREREQAAAAAAAAKQRDGARQREAAAMHAQREVERIRENERNEQKRRIEAMDRDAAAAAERARLEADRRGRLADESARRKAGDDMRRRAESKALRRRAEHEAKKREDEHVAREQEREAIRAQKREWQLRQQAVEKNRAAAEDHFKGPSPVREAPTPQHRRQWATPGQEEQGQGAASPSVPPPVAELTPEQRRAVWEEQRAGAARNRRAAGVADRGPGLAGFLGVPPPGPEEVAQGLGAAAAPRAGAAAPLSEEQRRAVWEEQRAGAERNRRAAGVADAGRAPAIRPRSGQPQPQLKEVRVPVEDAFERRRLKLEADAAQRADALKDWQRQHWHDMRDAAARNRAAIMEEVQGKGQPAKTVVNGVAAQPEGPQDDQDLEFAAMIKDMQDVLISDGAAGAGGAAAHATAESGANSDDNDEDGDKNSAALAGEFMLNGVPVPLPVRSDDSLALKVEALRMYLEKQLGTQPFLRVYRRLESLSLEDDEADVSREFLAVLGQAKLPYLQLIHQLIVCEEQLNCTA